MAQELVKGYGRSTLSPKCVIRIDLQKTFDSLDWNFIIEVLSVLKFPSMFINWIKSCITGSRFSISINGGLVGYFRGVKGVRQRDPLSPYLFVLTINVLSKMLDATVTYGVFNFHPRCKKIRLTHLCFVANLLIFAKGNLKSIIGVHNVMKKFYFLSGLQLNCAKSEIFSTGITRNMLGEIHNETWFKIGTLPVRYLGVPLVTRRLTTKDCAPLVDRIVARITCCSAKLLSHAGRIQLIQFAIFSLQNF